MSSGKVIFLQPEGSVLVPDDDTNEALVRALKPGRPVRLLYRQPRHGDHHKRIWKEFAEISVVLTAYGIKGYTDAEDVKRFALELTGNAHLVPVSRALSKRYGGEVEWAIRAASISYSAKDEAAITRFHEQWKLAFYEDVAPHLPQEVVDQIRGIFEWRAPRWYEAAA